jgi:L-fuculose-phosphate aldolase
MVHTTLRENLLFYYGQLKLNALSKGLSGNISVRLPNGFLISPSGLSADRLTASDFVEMSAKGESLSPLKPSSEWRFHKDIYDDRPEVQAIIHCHAPFCVALAAHHLSIPAYHYMVAKAGGTSIPCSDYATYGTQDLSDHVIRALRGHKACLMANHGLIATGRDLEEALLLAIEVEELAEGYWRALQLGKPILLDDEEMAVVIKKFSTYGNQAQK